MFENTTYLIFNVTRDCNLNCTYCFISNKNKYQGQRMTLDIFKSIINRWQADYKRNILNQSKKSNFTIEFQGGEPTLLEQSTLQGFIDYARSMILNIKFTLQTNGQNLDANWVDFFKKNTLQPGISIDGSKQQENSLRSGRSLNIFTIVRLFKKAGLTIGPLLVISRKNIRNFKNILQNFCKLFQTSSIRANPVCNLKTKEFADPEVSSTDLFKYLFLPTINIFLRKKVLLETNIRQAVEKYIISYLYADDPQAPLPNLFAIVNSVAAGISC